MKLFLAIFWLIAGLTWIVTSWSSALSKPWKVFHLSNGVLTFYLSFMYYSMWMGWAQ